MTCSGAITIENNIIKRRNLAFYYELKQMISLSTVPKSSMYMFMNIHRTSRSLDLAIKGDSIDENLNVVNIFRGLKVCSTYNIE